jgi:hypothetical protein
MTPEELAERHPRLYHVTSPGALPGILRFGLLPTNRLLDLFEVTGHERAAIERQRRPKSVTLSHPAYGEVVITDNYPLSETKLAACLDDGLEPADWLAILNQRVFFWPHEARVRELLNAKLNRGRDRLVLVLDTLSVASRHAERMELSPSNSGSTIHQPARRGLSTFTPLLRHGYATWQRLRRKRKLDRIKEVTVVDGVDSIADHLIDQCLVPGRGV